MVSRDGYRDCHQSEIILVTMAYMIVRRCIPIVSKVKSFWKTTAYNHVRRCIPIVSPK